MLPILQQFGYKPPSLVPGNYGNVQIVSRGSANEIMQLCVNNEDWMVYNTQTHAQAYEFFSHYFLAHGNVVTTGLGFGIRESWLATKDQITSLDVIERSKDLINYHSEHNADLLKDITVHHENARYIKLSCDVLLLDHYEKESSYQILEDVKNIHNRVDCKILWFWPFERIIMREYQTLTERLGKTCSILDAYNNICEKHQFTKMPTLNRETLNMFCFMYYSKLFSHSQRYLNPPSQSDTVASISSPNFFRIL